MDKKNVKDQRAFVKQLTLRHKRENIVLAKIKHTLTLLSQKLTSPLSPQSKKYHVEYLPSSDSEFPEPEKQHFQSRGRLVHHSKKEMIEQLKEAHRL